MLLRFYRRYYQTPAIILFLSALFITIMPLMPALAFVQTTPRISGFSPSSGPPGSRVVITGSGFKDVNSVTFNGVNANFSVDSDSQITAAAPEKESASGPITVSSKSGSSTSSSSFKVVIPPNPDAPEILDISPTSGLVGTSVSIRGKNFDKITGVTFNGVGANFNVGSTEAITATVPPGATSGPVVVSNGAGSSSFSSFTVIIPPTIDRISPNSGPVGSNVSIIGKNFTKSVSSVTFGGVSANFDVSSDTLVMAVVPDGAKNGPITLVNSSGSATSSESFTVVAIPIIEKISPTSGPVGSSVSIIGSGFKGASFVSFNGTSANFSAISDREITATVPPNAKTGVIQVRTPGGTVTSSERFEVVEVNKPEITGFSPTSGTFGTNVTINGRGFKDTREVAFNGVSANFTVISDGSITATVPEKATSGPISVSTSSGNISSAASFNVVVQPTISGFSPTSGPIGTTVAISGKNFGKVSAVAFGGVNAGFNVDSDSSITATVPAGAISGLITIVSSNGSAASAAVFNVTKPLMQPEITGFSPAAGPVGSAVSISGKNFTEIKSVTFGGVNAMFSVTSESLILTTVPTGAVSGLITVSGSGGSASTAAAFNVMADSALMIADFSPKIGSIGTTVQITGKGFSNTTLVAFNGVSSNFNVSSDSVITAAVPVGATSGVITISSTAGTASSASPFTIVSSSIQFAMPGFSVSESDGKATITVSRSGDTGGRATVAYQTIDSTAEAGTNYTAVSGRLVFERGVTSQSFTVPILDDNLANGDVAINLLLSDATDGAALAEPKLATLTVRDNEAASLPILQVTRLVDLGRARLGETITAAVEVRNVGTQPLTLSTPVLTDGAAAGYFIAAPLNSFNLKPGESAGFSVGFKPNSLNIDGVAGAISINSNGGNTMVALVARAVEQVAPSVMIVSPGGGEMLVAGKPFTLKFIGSDNDAVAGYIISYSLDGGANTMAEIARVDGNTGEVVWNVPDDLQTSQGQVQILAFDRSGNRAMTASGIFAIARPVNNAASLQVVLTFEPPPPNQIQPPANVKLTASELGSNRAATSSTPAVDEQRQMTESSDDSTGQIEPQDGAASGAPLLGYNIYRVPQPPPEQPLPTPTQITGDPKNLIGSISADSTVFTDQVSTGSGNNFVYSITSFFGNGQSSGGSQPNGTDLPVVKNPVFTKGTIFLDAAGSFIKSGAKLFLDDSDSFVLRFDDSGTRFTVDKKSKGSASGLTLKKLLKKGSTVRLTVINPDGKRSVGIMFQR